VPIVAEYSGLMKNMFFYFCRYFSCKLDKGIGLGAYYRRDADAGFFPLGE
jgi:hypothetical protein